MLGSVFVLSARCPACTEESSPVIEPPRPSERIIAALRERAKELNGLYAVEELLRHDDEPVEAVLKQVLDAIPSGWQYPEICHVKLTFDGTVYRSGEVQETPWMQRADLVVRQRAVGTLQLYYEEQRPLCDVG